MKSENANVVTGGPNENKREQLIYHQQLRGTSTPRYLPVERERRLTSKKWLST